MKKLTGKKRMSYTSEFKFKVVMELLKEEKTVQELASEYKVDPKSLRDWKKEFLENGKAIFEKKSISSSHKAELNEKQEEIDELHRQIGQLTAQVNWAKKKFNSLDFRLKESLISKDDELPIIRQCEMLSFNRSTYYYEHKKKEVDKNLLEDILKIYEEKPFYGYRRTTKDLNLKGYKVGAKKVVKIRHLLGLETFYPKKRTSILNSEHKKYPYLLNEIEISSSNKVWSADITYIKLMSGWMYLVAVIDWYSRKILSYELSNTMDTDFCIRALSKAISKYGKPEIFNTDQGCQFTSNEFTSVLTSHDISISMDGKGRWADNIFIERFFRTIKYENIFIKKYDSVEDLKKGVKEYINFYNQERLHSSLNYQTPDAVYFYKNIEFVKAISKKQELFLCFSCKQNLGLDHVA